MAPSPDDFAAQWRERLASGSKLAARALGQALKDEPSRIALIAPLARDPLPTVRISTLRAFEEAAATRPALVAEHAKEIVEALAAPEADAQSSALATLALIAHHASAETALALPLIADLLRAKRPALREEAARCLGRLGTEAPRNAAEAAACLGEALRAAKGPRASQEAREILASLELLLPHLPPEERRELVGAVQPMRGHPNLQVRERAGRITRLLAQ